MNRTLLLGVIAQAACGHGAPPRADVPAEPAQRPSTPGEALPPDAGVAVEPAAPPPAPPPIPDEPVSGCRTLVVGAAHERGTLCEEIDEGYWRVTRQVIRVDRGARAIAVLDVLTKIEGFDTGEKELQVELIVAADGMSITMVDGVPSLELGAQPGPSDTCEGPPPREARSEVRRGREPTYLDLRRTFCRARGTYRWRGGRFVRAR